MRLLLPAAASVASVFLLVAACGGTDTPADTTPAAGDDDDASTTSHDASSGDGSTTTTDSGLITGDSAPTGADTGTTTPTVDGGDEIACSGTASCNSGDPCIADYPTAQVATNWCKFDGVAKRITEYAGACSGYHVVQIATAVIGALTTSYYDPNSGALVAIVHTSLNTEKACTGSPAEVSSTPCGDTTGVVTVLDTSCTD